jgi:Protein of unknown function (DUF4232)
MSPKTLTGVCAFTLMGVLAAGCSSSISPKKSAPPTSTTHPSTTTSSSTTSTTSAPSTPTSTVPGDGPCTSAHLSVGVGQSQGAAGTFYYPLVFTNTGTNACTLQGYPGVSLVGSNGNQIGSPAARTTSSLVLVSLAPGSATTATISLSDALNVCSNPVTPDGFRVYPPNQTAALYAPYPGLKYCVGNPNGTLQITAVGFNPGG